MEKNEEKVSAPAARISAAFLIAQIGAHAADAFAKRVEKIGLTPPQAGILRMIAVSEGLSQKDLATRLGILPSSLVALMDDLEKRGLVERRSDPKDRRPNALHLTAQGFEMLAAMGKVAQEHDEAVCAALTPAEKSQLTELLQRIAGEQGLTPGVHPGYRSIGRRRRNRSGERTAG
jgi:DNA-binding MarR family transcriptional regulator